MIGDPGSCHLGSLDRAKALIRAGASAGVWAVKFQLFSPGQAGDNIVLPHEWMPLLIEEGSRYDVVVFASVFDASFVGLLRKYGCGWVKIPFSKRNDSQLLAAATDSFDMPGIVISHAYVDATDAGMVNLWCIPEYPVLHDIAPEVFTGLFTSKNCDSNDRGGFQGFSDHTVGVRQTLTAIDNGAMYIEKHFRLGDEDDFVVPDGRFAVTPEELLRICAATDKGG